MCCEIFRDHLRLNYRAVAMAVLIAVTELLSVFLVTAVFIYYVYYRYCFTYWKKKGLPSLNPMFPFGDLSLVPLGKESVFVRVQKLYHQFKEQGHKSGGIYFFNGPIYLPVHPEMVKKVIVTDFDYFVDRGMYINEKKIPLTAHMFSMNGEQWKTLRNKFSPVFTAGKMKSMYTILLKNCENLMNSLEPAAEQNLTVNLKVVLGRFTTDIIGSTAFGVDVNSLKNPDSEFVRMVEKIFECSRWKLLKLAIEEGLQNPGNLIKIAHDNKTVEEYFNKLVKETIEYRDQNNIARNDFLDILMQMRSTVGMSFQEIVAQSFLFFTAGFETSSSTMSYCIHELMHHQDLQDAIREEIHEELGRDATKYTYEGILALPSLDRAIKETLRIYPPVPILNRICVKSYKDPESNAIIDKGTPVLISVLGLHRDPEFFPDPLHFDPERFNGENKITAFTYLPFGDGPRNCIGLRFGLMQTKLGLATLLNDYKFVPAPETVRTLEIDPHCNNIVLSIVNDINVKLIKL